MAIHLHRSNRTEILTDSLCQVLSEVRPEDPFQPIPVVVGSRGMERWLRHEIATRMHVAAGLQFPFPRQALAGAGRWLLDGAQDRQSAFWNLEPDARDRAERWDIQALTFRVLRGLRRRRSEPGFEEVSRYLEGDGVAVTGAAVSARELLFAGEVAEVLDRLMHDRPETVLSWCDQPVGVPAEHRWLGTLLADLGAGIEPDAPAVMHRALMRCDPIGTGRALCLFGLSTLGPGDRERLTSIARSVEVHLFVLVAGADWPEGDGPVANAVLASLGTPGRDLDAWLRRSGYQGVEVPLEDPRVTEQPTLLHRLQGWIVDGASAEQEAGRWASDATVSAHSTWGALRQCEVLRDQLLTLFDEQPDLEPRDVLVMTPDIRAYAPLVAAVFSRTGLSAGSSAARLPRIPVSIADLGLRQTNSVAEVLLSVLDLAGDRLSASRVVEFLALQPVRNRWGLNDEDLADLRALIRESGLRWGVDASERAAADQPALDQNTVRFGLERLALGVLMPDDGPLAVVEDLSGELGPAVPLDIESSDRARRTGLLAAILRTLAAHRRAMVDPATLEGWRERITAALDELAAPDEEQAWLRSEVDTTLADLARIGDLLEGLEVERAAVLRWLQDGFEIPQRGDRPITGAVQVCALEPMRSVPFRVVALLGMDDRAFPRGSRPRTWDPMGERLPGERDRREIDRHLLLEAILSARDRLLLLWSGHDVQQGRQQPAAVPIEELLETLGTLTGRSRSQLVVRHPLQPWSAANFGAPAASFDQGMALAALRLREIAAGEREARPLGLASAGETSLPSESARPEVLELGDLAGALLAAQKLLLRERLGLSLRYGEAPVPDREPLELDNLEAWSLRQRLLRHLVEEDPALGDDELVEAVRRRMGGEGLLPLQSGGRGIVADELGRARAVLYNLRDVHGEPDGGLELSVSLEDGSRLVGRADDRVRADGGALLQWHTPSAGANDRLQLLAWLHLLAAVAAGEDVAGARLVGHRSGSNSRRAGGDFLAFEGTPEEARAALTDLVAVWRSARDRPVPLFRRTSASAAGVLSQVGDDLSSPGAGLKLVGAVATGWSGGFNAQGDVEDPWVRTFFVDYDPLDHLDDRGPLSLLGLARRVWLPVIQGLSRGKPLGAAWRKDDGR